MCSCKVCKKPSKRRAAAIKAANRKIRRMNKNLHKKEISEIDTPIISAGYTD